ncbi:MAG: transglutaminase domain-containing protein [Agathobacter sp.]|nr:transglutaminase domain-containing protein [Agathobacter sp.]
MINRIKKTSLVYLSILLCCFTLCACGDSATDETPKSTEKGSRDNTSVVLVPEATGTAVHSCDSATVDVSNISEGYIMADYHGTSSKVKLQITGPDGVTYTYNLHGGYETFPVTAGNGTYTIGVFENISETKYSTALSFTADAGITNEFGPYLYPNQYVNFNASSLPVSKAVELAYTANTDLEVVENVYNYIIDHFTYDYDKAKSVVSGYLPVVDDVYRTNTGICFDYAAVMATMLRSQNIPTRLEVGYMGEEYHAWISIYIEDIGWINGIIEFDGSTWNLMDPTFASTSKSPSDFITEDSKYLTKYVY